jgi:hypothetical protein
MTIFSHQDRKMIASRIEQLKNKKSYKTIFKIIYQHNNNYITNEKGVFINMNNVDDETLESIKKFLDESDNNKTIIPIPKELTSDDALQTDNVSSFWNTDTEIIDKTKIAIKPFNLCLND